MPGATRAYLPTLPRKRDERLFQRQNRRVRPEQATARRTARDPGPHPARGRFPTKKSRCALGKTPPRRDRRFALPPSATLSRTKKQDAPPSFSARENVRRGSPPMFFPSPHQICGMADRPARLRRQHQSAADLRADAPCISALPEAQNKKKTMPKHRLFLFNTPENRRKHQSP